MTNYEFTIDKPDSYYEALYAPDNLVNLSEKELDECEMTARFKLEKARERRSLSEFSICWQFYVNVAREKRARKALVQS